MNRKKKAVISLSAVFLLVCGIVGGIALYNNMIGDVSKVDVDSLPIKTMKGSFVYDTTNIKEAVGIVDYVFVGNVVSNDGTVYEDIVAMEDKNGRTKEVGTPYTNYTVRVLDNIKGELQTNDQIQVVKQGGIAQDRKSILVFENDALPKAGQNYIFLAYAQPDGSLLISGPDSNIPITSSASRLNAENAASFTEYAAYKEACENEIVPVERERYTSVYEK